MLVAVCLGVLFGVVLVAFVVKCVFLAILDAVFVVVFFVVLWVDLTRDSVYITSSISFAPPLSLFNLTSEYIAHFAQTSN